jgi:ABC-type transport system substrate-binding protein
MQAKALAEYGPDYMLDPATHVSSGPFIMTEFTPGESATFVANPTYNGFRPPWLQRVEVFFGDPATQFLAFQDHQIEWVLYENISPADFEIIDADPELAENYLANPGDFRTEYLLMDTYNPPFDNVLVRQAFAKALDRDSIVANIIGPRLAIPAYSMLSPGFPASDVDGSLRQYQAYDCEAAQALLAEAGYPNGEGFPDQILQLRNENEIIVPRYVAAAASISECLNVNIEVNNLDFTTYMDALNARPTELTFGGVSYGMDYLDPANMMGTLWLSDGRHSWRNEEFDAIAREANSLVGDPDRRTELYKEAERILVEDVGGIFLNHRIQGHIFQPYLQGAFRDLNAQGLPGWQWGNDWMWSSFYIDATVANYDTYRDN